MPWVRLAGGSEQLPGELLFRDETTGNIRFQQAGGQPKIYQRSEYARLDPPMTATEVVQTRGKLMLGDKATDWSLEISRTLRWGMENDAQDAARALAVAAMEAYPKDLSLAEQVIPMLEGRQEHLDALVRSSAPSRHRGLRYGLHATGNASDQGGPGRRRAHHLRSVHVHRPGPGPIQTLVRP